MITPRPFAGLASEPDLVTLREVVPSASAPLSLRAPADGHRRVRLVTVLPLTWPAMVGTDDVGYVALQTPGRSGDVSRDLGQAITAVLAASEPGPVPLERDDEAPRLQELLADEPLDITVHDNLAFWSATHDPAGVLSGAQERADAGLVPTARLSSVESAYWCRMKERCHLRWALRYDEEPALDALARLHAAGRLGLGDGTRYVGSFRAHGLLVPVWDLPAEMTADQLEAPAAAVAAEIAEAVASPRALTADERRARAGLLSRQLTLR